MENKYVTLIREHEGKLKKENIIFDILGYVKLFLILVIGFIIYLLFVNEFRPEYLILFLSVFIILAVFWVYHAKVNDRINYSKGIIAICNRQIDRITGKWTAFEDTGAEFADADHAYACDLDVVGAKSLFQFLNTTYTWHGRQSFANDLLKPAYGRSELQKRQEAIAELSKGILFSCMIQYYLSKIKTEPTPALFNNLKDKTPFIKRNAIRIILTYLPALTLLFVISVIIFQQQSLYIACTLVITAQMAIWGAGMPKTYKYLGIVSHLPYELRAYANVINILINSDFSCEKLKQIREQVNGAAQAIKDLGRIADRIRVRHNLIIYFILNALLLWDYECAFLLQKWKQKYAHLTGQWFSAIGEFESLLSFSHLPNACDNTCLPVLSEKEKIIEAKGMGHPLLPNEHRVNNELSINNNIFIISGSNMSGKTTFLRTVGVNLVLAYSGGFVCAEAMVFSRMGIVTQMRVADSLNEGISTFYAELKRIKMIIDYAEKQPLMFLIDEIFKGTNSVDRLAGAKTVIAKLNALGAVGMISTHDLELCELEGNYARIKNYSFSERYKDNRIYFDYRIKQGKSSVTNAKYLMKMVGITD